MTFDFGIPFQARRLMLFSFRQRYHSGHEQMCMIESLTGIV